MHRVTLVPYLRGWSYDLTARALMRHLSDRFDFRVIYQEKVPRVAGVKAELYVDFWWKGALHRRLGRHVLKQVSSHRWVQERYGTLDVDRLTHDHLVKTGGVIVPSKRLAALLPDAPHVTVCPKGFHPDTFGDFDQRRGGLEVGWAGAAEATDKNVETLVKAWPSIRLADRCLTYQEMPDFYNSVDVITCASDAEGDPRPLIEGMACGCFPVVVDVGIVPELVRHGENGLIVERTPQAFAEAFAWCARNIDIVRAAGRKNAVEMLSKRTWKHCAEHWATAFNAAIERTGGKVWEPSRRDARAARFM